MTRNSKAAEADRGTSDKVGTKSPMRQSPDFYGEEEDISKNGKLQAKDYGVNARFNPDAEETQSEEYKEGGLPDTQKYAVQKQKKSEPAVTTPKKEDARQTDKSERNYGF